LYFAKDLGRSGEKKRVWGGVTWCANAPITLLHFKCTIITTTSLPSRIPAIAPPHRDNGIENRSVYLPDRLPACSDSFAIAVPGVHSESESCERCLASRELPFSSRLLHRSSAVTNSFDSSIEIPLKTMPASLSSSQSRTTSSSMRS